MTNSFRSHIWAIISLLEATFLHAMEVMRTGLCDRFLVLFNLFINATDERASVVIHKHVLCNFSKNESIKNGLALVSEILIPNSFNSLIQKHATHSFYFSKDFLFQI